MPGIMEFSTEEFVNFDTRGRGTFLGSEWKKQGWINVWLHRRRPFAAMWQHGIPRIDAKDDPQTGRSKRAIFPGSYKCLEENSTLVNQYRRDKETGERQYPAEVCPICSMIEHVHQMVLKGELHWLAPVFEFAVGDPKQDVLIRAGGMWNQYGSRYLTDEQKQEMEDASVSPKFGWKENMQAGLKYVFCLVDDAAVGKGVQIMKESQSLGDKVKTAIAKEMKRNSRDRSKGDPILNPYAFCFEYKEDETPDKKYDAFRVEDLVLTPEINKLITESEAPDISRYEGSYSPETLRSQLERCCLIDGLPWDDFFSSQAIALLARKDEEEFPPKAEPKTAARPVSAPRGRQVLPPGRQTTSSARPGVEASGRSRPAPQPAPDKEEMFACNGCDHPIGATEATCRNCGHEYDPEPAAPPPPPALRRRSDAKAPPPAQKVDGAVAASPRATKSARPQREAAPAGGPPVGAADVDPGFGEFTEEKLPF